MTTHDYTRIVCSFVLQHPGAGRWGIELRKPTVQALWGKSCSGSTLHGPGVCRSPEQSRRADYLQADCFAPGQGQGVASVERMLGLSTLEVKMLWQGIQVHTSLFTPSLLTLPS